MHTPGTPFASFGSAPRPLARRPGFSAAAALALALGIGANTATFSAVAEERVVPEDIDGRSTT
jgi:hypothetical protein